jgi:DNA polymerase bacteriophage-type
MPKVLHLDWETFCEKDIRDVGAFRYANDPSCEILIGAMAFDYGDPVAWDCTMEEWECDHLIPYWKALEDPEVLIWCHNAQFEMAICLALLEKTWGIKCPDLSRFRCTMSLARRASLPGKLEKLSEVLQLKNLKDNRGKALIKKFSVMQPPKRPTKAHPQGLPERRIRPQDDPAAFQEFIEYCRQDIRTEQGVHQKLVYFDDRINAANYSLDAKINARGVPVNLQALRHAQKLIDEETEIVSRKFRELTGFEVTQNAVLLKWVNENGYSFENLQAETVDTFLEGKEKETCPRCKGAGVTNTDADIECEGFLSCPDCGGTSIPDKVVLALRLKQSIAYASIKKVKTMLECAGPHDNRIRGMLNHHGATTGRWTASLVQFQNMKRPTIKHSEDAYREICEGVSREMLEICYGPVLEVISSCIRHFVHDVKN